MQDPLLIHSLFCNTLLVEVYKLHIPEGAEFDP